MDFRDEIVKSGQLDWFGQPITGNAPQSLHAGIEFAANVQTTNWLSLSGNMTFSQNELKNIPFSITTMMASCSNKNWTATPSPDSRIFWRTLEQMCGIGDLRHRWRCSMSILHRQFRK
ncbi:MAG: hypothetical protein R3C26_14695 [Calditrichia bacterium]